MKFEHWPMIEAVSDLDKEFIASSFEKFYPDDRIRDVIIGQDPIIEYSLLTKDTLIEIVLESPTLDRASGYRDYIILSYTLNHGIVKNIGVFRTINNHWSINSRYRSKL